MFAWRRRRAKLTSIALGVTTVLAVSGYAAPSALANERECPDNSISSNFNGTPIGGGDTIWFNSVVKASVPTNVAGEKYVEFRNQTITFSAGGQTFSQDVPPTRINYSPTATKASGEFNEGLGRWIITVPASFGDNVFLSGVKFQVPSGGLPGGIGPVTWSGDIFTRGEITLSWQWGAAVYTKFGEHMGELGVKLTHSTSLDEYPNEDQAGTPENFKSFVVGGATGEGGSNFTGSYSSTGRCAPPPTCPSAPEGYPNLGGASQFTVFALNGSGGKQTANFSLDTVKGDVGVASGATVTNQAPSTVTGNVFVDSGGTFSGPGKVGGTVFRNQDLSAARTGATEASAEAAGLAPNFTFSSISSNTTVTGVAGLNVVDVTGNVSLNNASLTLTGPSNAFFVVNVGGSINLGGTGGIKVGGSVPNSQLLINMTNHGSINTHVGNVVEGTLLGPNSGGSLDGAFGSLLLGGNFSLMSGVQVTFQGCPL